MDISGIRNKLWELERLKEESLSNLADDMLLIYFIVNIIWKYTII